MIAMILAVLSMIVVVFAFTAKRDDSVTLLLFAI
jgi:hypothetical protein